MLPLIAAFFTLVSGFWWLLVSPSFIRLAVVLTL
jgi:hypothetical protein